MKPIEVRIVNTNSTKNIGIVRDFINSGMEVALIEGYPHKDAKVCVTAISRVLKSAGLDDTVDVFRRKDKVFLIRID